MLTFLSSSEPTDILSLVTAYPEFNEYYKDIVEFRKKPKELISMYSEALAILDHNTELYMISELQNTVKELKDTISQSEAELAQKKAALAEQNVALAEQSATLAEQSATLAEQSATINEKKCNY